MITPSKPKGISRRHFSNLTGKAATAIFGFQFIPSHAWGQLTKPVLGAIGSGGKGRSDISGSDQAGFQVAALCDVVDGTRLDVNGKRFRSIVEARKTYSKTRFFTDYREMLASMGDRIDAVTVSTPDHHHFHASVLAMKAGKHVYCQKPLTHGIWEARMMAQVAQETGVKTQMGNQAHANDHMRRCAELIRAGVIGKVKEVHAWTNRPIWPQGFKTAPEKQPVPKWLDWEQWIGPAPWVDYNQKIAPFTWRGWWDYGTGALGDMACHIMDLGYWALLPGSPKSVMAHQEGATELSPPINSKIVWEFGPSPSTSADGFKYFWYDGYINAHFDRSTWNLVKDSNEYNHPDNDVLDGMSFKDFGCVIIGEEGKLFFNRGRNTWVVKASRKIDGFVWPDQSIPRARKQNNYLEWMDAIQGRVERGQSGFHHTGPFTETILLGVLAQRVPDTKLVWNAERMEVKGRPELKKFIQRPYRQGWQIEV
ncbi:MAG TPA: Gfo/Idh/MocA family oxidoreductase [Verrucomicrobiales bacterium]|nr:Gfo/Idh/MocA family oxidoreductase [Verrucomicrobiales bacterium]HIL71144.1 Gfo/Idh/MocA family oxidoreductase [Verrucomicrobiota bacterium]